MILTEVHIKNNKEFVNLCNLSKELYNKAMFLCRQNYFKHKNSKDVLKIFLFYNNLYSLLKDSTEYKSLPAQTSQAILKQVDKAWKSYRKLIKVYWKDKSKFKALPKLPNYLKGKKLNIVIYPGQNLNGTLRIKGHINIPKTNIKIQTKLSKIKELRIVPYYGKFKVELIYEKEIINHDLNKDYYIGLDLGVNNLVSITSNQEHISSYLINGRTIKSINQYYNKKHAKLKSILQKVNKQKTSKQLYKLLYKRQNKLNDYFHKVSKQIISFCIENKIKNIVIGHNDNWKQKCNLGKRNNQNFIQIPFNKLIHMIQYKGELNGIKVILTEESYTSKIDHLSLEEMKYQIKYLGERKTRGLFQSQYGLLNADINGSIGILRKVIGNDFIKSLSNRGLVYRPFKITC